MGQLSFTIVLIVKNDLNLLLCSLLSINHLTYPTNKFEVIVIDDGTTPSLENKINTSQFNYNLKIHYLVPTETSSRAKARNTGAAMASHSHIVFIDGDHF
ncbi:hypothetical protein TDB9533_01329 [Thalassocella blandensis]|nr:hypothetical protein TDB9533_01329 [Thalassocella blandensis]